MRSDELKERLSDAAIYGAEGAEKLVQDALTYILALESANAKLKKKVATQAGEITRLSNERVDLLRDKAMLLRDLKKARGDGLGAPLPWYASANAGPGAAYTVITNGDQGAVLMVNGVRVPNDEYLYSSFAAAVQAAEIHWGEKQR